MGNTDREWAFFYLLQQLRQRFGDASPVQVDLTPVLTELTREIVPPMARLT